MSTIRIATLAAMFFLMADWIAHADGGVDNSFISPYPDYNVDSMAIQADGKIVIGGEFTVAGAFTRNHIARLNVDGSVDGTFDPNANGDVLCLVLQSDGKIVLGGGFTTLGGAPQNRIARLNADGTVDTSFNVGANGAVNSVVIQRDGKIVLAGNFTAVGGLYRYGIARLNPDGSVDTSFHPDVYASCLLLQPDGKIIADGYLRLNPDGSVDTSFKCSGASDRVLSLVMQPDGKIVMGGRFTSVGAFTRSHIARLNVDGSVDGTFDPSANGSVCCLALQSDGKIMVGGGFTTLGGAPQNRIARLNFDGSVDSSFNAGTDDFVGSLALQPDGKILLGGQFTWVTDPETQQVYYLRKLTRLDNGMAVQSLTASSTTLTWSRGGTAPEVDWVVFETSLDQSSWTVLGPGTRVSSGWQATGLSLPPGGIYLMAFAGGQNSSLLIESQAGPFSFTIPPAAPVALAADSITETGFRANWGAITGATGYYLDVSTDSNFGSFVTGYDNLDAGLATSAPVRDLVCGTSYYYRVRAYDPYGASVSSNTANIWTIPAPPSAFGATALTITGFTANWSTVNEASGYYLDVAADPDFKSLVTGFSGLDVGNVTSTSVSGLSPATRYYYRVRAYTADCISRNSNTVDVTTESLTYTLRVIVAGAGTVHSSPGPDVACSSDCSQSYTWGTVVTLTPQADSGNLFGGYSNCDAPSCPSCSMTMNADKGTTATFWDQCQIRLRQMGYQP